MKKTNEEKLQEALAKLLDKKLSVTLLCEKADISRGTFYLYYNDIDEFLSKTEDNIIEKYFLQIEKIFFCPIEELPYILKKEKLLFDEKDRKLLAYFAKGSKYIDFAVRGIEGVLSSFKDLCKEEYGEKFYNENEKKLTYCLNGVASILFFSLTRYDEKKLIAEMQQCRKIISTVIGK